MTNTHTGTAQLRLTGTGRKARYVVLCPRGHLVTSGGMGSDSGFAGSAIAARISAHQAGTKTWVVTCTGA